MTQFWIETIKHYKHKLSNNIETLLKLTVYFYMFCTFFVFVHLNLSSIIRIVFGISHQPNAAGTMLLHCEQKHCHNESSQTRQMRVRMAKRNERWLMSVSHWDVDISIANREMSDRQCEHSGAAVSCRFVMNEFNIHGRIRAIFRNRYYVWYYNTFMLYCKGLLYCIFFFHFDAANL